VDLRLSEAKPTSEERGAVDALLGAPSSGWDGLERREPRDGHVAFGGHAARARRHLLLPALHALQSAVGWISEGGLMYVCTRLSVPPAEAWGVATFYGLLATTPRPKRVLHVCDDIACRLRGAQSLIAALEREVGPAYVPPDGGTARPPRAAWLRAPCLGLCDHAPAALLTVAGEYSIERLSGNLTPDQAVRAVTKGEFPDQPRQLPPQLGDPSLRLLRRIGVVDPTDLAAYEKASGYRALRKAVEMGPAAVIREVMTSGLRGRGGAAFPTGRKWEAVATQPPGPRYVICNADESEPGTFMDRSLLEGDPFAIVEATTIAAFAVGAEQGYAYVRGEYPLAMARLDQAIRQARREGWLGENVGGLGFRFDMEVRKGAGAYICGEETAVFNSIEGYRGEPRNKPPFPVEAGLFGKPTLINNVETLANIPSIVLEGGEAFAAIGTKESTGPKLFCLCGAVQRPGVYEVPFGATLGQLLDMAGAPETSQISAILLGGAAGMFVRGDERDIPLTFEGARAAGVTLGSGVIMVFDREADLVGTVLRIAEFFRDESCGQCVPCRVGTVRQEEALRRLAAKRARGGARTEIALLEEIGMAMKDASICGLGQTAYSAVESAIKRLRLFQEAAP
jgi:NADH-quinone oxidoreductase subunit F